MNMSKVEMLVPARTMFEGRPVTVRSLTVPERMAPFIHHTRVATELASQEVIPGKTLVQFGKLQVVSLDIPQEMAITGLSGREQRLFDEAVSHFGTKDQSLLMATRAATEAAQSGQVRKDGEPYITHPIDVLHIMTNRFGIADIDLALAALSHDMLEDTGTTKAELARSIGARAADLVDTVTRKKEQGQSDTEYIEAIIADNASAILKCGDMFSNAGNLFQLADDKTRARLTYKYYPEIRNYLQPWAVKTGHNSVSEIYGAWLTNDLVLTDLAAHIRNSEGKAKLEMGGN